MFGGHANLYPSHIILILIYKRKNRDATLSLQVPTLIVFNSCVVLTAVLDEIKSENSVSSLLLPSI